MDVGRYHKFLRVSATVCAFVLVFDSGIFLPVTKQISNHTLLYVANVGTGMFASVPPNEINSISAQLAEQKRLLDERETALGEREIKSRQFDASAPDYSVYILSAILFILTLLIIINYILDWNRFKKVLYERKTI